MSHPTNFMTVLLYKKQYLYYFLTIHLPASIGKTTCSYLSNVTPEYFLKCLLLHWISRHFLVFMKPTCSWPSSHQHTTSSYYKREKSSRHPSTLFLCDKFQQYPPVYAQVLETVSSHKFPQPKFCTHFSSVCYALHVTLTPSFLIWITWYLLKHKNLCTKSLKKFSDYTLRYL